MPTSKGRETVRRYLQKTQTELRNSILEGAARKMANVVAEKAKQNLGGKTASNGAGRKVLIANTVKVKTKRDGSLIRSTVYLKGEGAYVGIWLEWGTQPHFISIDPEFSRGRTVRRTNELDSDARKQGRPDPSRSLFINGRAVGKTVYHPGAAPHPFLRPAFDMMENEARSEGMKYIIRRLKDLRRGIGHNGGPELGDMDDE